MKKQQTKIQQFKLASETGSGILIAALTEDLNPSHNTGKAHRDDHFNLMFAFTGAYHLKIDFIDYHLKAPFILCINPNQIHQVMAMSGHSGWLMAIDEFILESEFKHLLLTTLSKPLFPEHTTSTLWENIQTILNLAFGLQNRSVNPFTHKSIIYLINSLFCLLSEPAARDGETNSKETRAHIIEYSFRELLQKEFKNWKNPAKYALELSITTSHLNDVLKDTTGLSTSTHIQQYNVLQAKRLLYATDMEVREIAFELGYDDVVHFSKLFKKINGTTCLQFRKKFRD